MSAQHTPGRVRIRKPAVILRDIEALERQLDSALFSIAHDHLVHELVKLRKELVVSKAHLCGRTS